jgi:hypothetical protein
VELILDNLDESAAHPADWREAGDFEYLYRERCVLALDADEQRVGAELRQILATEETPEPEVNAERGHIGVTRLWWPEPTTPGRMTPAVLDQIDAALGAGVARPDHVLYICPYPCPATEPEEVPPGTVDPYPRPGEGYPGASCCRGRWHGGAGRGCDGDGVLVEMVDTGLLPDAAENHRWLADVTGDIEQPLDSASNIRVYAGHGTFGAGCVRATAPRASVDVKGALLHAGADYETNVVPKLAEALEESPDLVVFTFVAPTRLELSLLGFDAVYESRIRQVKGLAFLAPAGNDAERSTKWPAAYPWVVSVGALSANWRSRAYFSNYGGWVDVYAPGEDLVNAFTSGTYKCKEPPNVGVERTFHGMAKWSGTSFSTPLVAGLIAARMSATGENAQQAAGSLLRLARAQAIPGVGPVLLPGQACCDPERGHSADCAYGLGPRRGCGCGCGQGCQCRTTGPISV